MITTPTEGTPPMPNDDGVDEELCQPTAAELDAGRWAASGEPIEP